MRMTLWMPVTPARVSETRTRGAEACTSCRSATSSLAGVVTLRIVRALRCDQLQLPPTTPPVIKRFLRRRHEPRSIFEHIDAHVRPDVPGLTKGGDELPDEAEFSEGGISFAPGALEGILRGPGDPEEVEAAVERIYGALAALAEDPNATTRAQLRETFREGHVRARMDALRDRLNAAPPPHTELLYPELRELFLRSGHRDEVKYSMALLGGFRRPEDADLFRIVGRHEEFTLYAAVALASVTDDPVNEWLGMLVHVKGWGRTELAELILRSPQSELVREQLVRGGLGVGNALELAEGCRLDQILAHPEVDDELLSGARDIIWELAESVDSPADLADYGYAGWAVENLLRHLAERTRSDDDRRAVAALQTYLTSEQSRYEPETGADRFPACGLDEQRLARVLALCEEYLAAS